MKPLFHRAAVRAFLDQALLVAVAAVVGLALVVLVTDCHVERVGDQVRVQWGSP